MTTLWAHSSHSLEHNQLLKIIDKLKSRTPFVEGEDIKPRNAGGTAQLQPFVR